MEKNIFGKNVVHFFATHEKLDFFIFFYSTGRKSNFCKILANLGNLCKIKIQFIFLCFFCYRLFKKLYLITIEWLEVRKTNCCKNFSILAKMFSIYFLCFFWLQTFQKVIAAQLQLNDWKSGKQIIANTLQIWASRALKLKSSQFLFFFLCLQAFQKAITYMLLYCNLMRFKNKI